jgi:hypothetical protein
LGGPIRKDRTFFFTNADALRERRGLSRLATVPEASARAGDFSSLSTPVLDPFTRQPFPGNRIPGSRISPVARRVLDLFPIPNRGGASQNYLAQPTLSEDTSQANARVDHRLTDVDTLVFRYSYVLRNMFEPFAEESTDIPGFGNLPRDRGHNAMAQWTRTFGLRTVSSLRFGFNRALRSVFQEGLTTDVNRLWGITWLPTRPVDYGFPAVTVAGFSRAGDANALPIDRAATTFQVTQDLAFVRGAHTWKTGFEIRRIQMYGILDLFARGSLTFSGQLTGNGMADLLLGLPTLGIRADFDNSQTLRYYAYNTWIQDDWHVTPTLTLNLGLRYEYNSPAQDPFDRMSILNLSTGKLSRVGTDGISRSGVRPDKNNLAPRFGFAWNPERRLVLRGGYGVYYDAGIGNVSSALYFNPPFYNIRVYFPTATSLLTLNDPFPQTGGISPPASLTTLNPDMSTAYLQHWNFAVQREIVGAGVFTVAYAGSKGTHLIRSRDLNQPRPGSSVAVQDRRPLPAFANILIAESSGNSNYHSLQTTWNRPIGNAWSVLAAYTWSRSIDDTSAFLSTKADKNFAQDSSNYGSERALSSYDTPHRFTLAGTWHPGASAAWLKRTEFSSIVVAQSGQPFTPILRFDNSNTGNTGGNFGSDRPNVVGDPSLEHRSPQEWFNTSAFAVPPRNAFGNAGRNILRGPAYFTVDLALARTFPLREWGVFRLEAQAFNLLNRANFDLPERYADEPATFGRINSAKAPRQIQFALRFSF